MATSRQDDMRRARVTLTIEVPGGEVSIDRVRRAVAISLDTLPAATEARIISVDAVELVESDANGLVARQPVDQYGRTFWESASAEQLAAEQGVGPVHSIDELFGNFWPEDEGPDDFINWLREQRRTG
jgi:hypothetical protein